MESSSNESRRNRNRRNNSRQRNRDEQNNRQFDRGNSPSDKSGDGSSRDLLNRKHPEFFARKSFSEIAEKELTNVDRTLQNFVCPKCGQPITDLASAMADKTSGEPLHFDCVLKIIEDTETLKADERIVYVGQGRFAVAHFENIHDARHFDIVRIIEWESREKKYEWRNNIASLYSQIH